MQAGYKTIKKPWGEEQILESNGLYCFKKIIIYKGCGTSLQYHSKKVETSVIHSGIGLFSFRDEHGNILKKEVGPGFVAKLDSGVLHRFEALEEILLYECSTAYEGFENDVIRIEDSYGREGTNSP